MGTYCWKYFHSRRTNLTYKKTEYLCVINTCGANAKLMCFFVLLAMSCMRLNESPAAMLCYAMFYKSLFSTAKWRRCFISLCSPQQNGGNVVFFSHRSRNGGSACLFVFVPQCLWGEGATAANAVAMRPLWPKHLDHAPCLQSRPYPYPSPTQTIPHPTGTMRECANEV